MRVRCEVRRRGPALLHRDRYVGLAAPPTPARKLRRRLPAAASGAALGCWSAMLLLVLYSALVSDQITALMVLMTAASGATIGTLLALIALRSAPRKQRRTRLRATPWADPHPPLWLASPAPVAISAGWRLPRAHDRVADRLPELLKP